MAQFWLRLKAARAGILCAGSGGGKASCAATSEHTVQGPGLRSDGWGKPLFEEGRGHPPEDWDDVLRRAEVAYRECALEDDSEFAGERRRVVRTRPERHVANHRLDVVLGLQRRPMDRVGLAGELGDRVHEEASAENVSFQDFDEQRDEFVQLSAGVGPCPLREEFPAVVPPPSVVPVDDVGDQSFLAVEVPVEPLLGDPDGPEDALEADGVESLGVKQCFGGFE